MLRSRASIARVLTSLICCKQHTLKDFRIAFAPAKFPVYIFWDKERVSTRCTQNDESDFSSRTPIRYHLKSGIVDLVLSDVNSIRNGTDE